MKRDFFEASSKPVFLVAAYFTDDVREGLARNGFVFKNDQSVPARPSARPFPSRSSGSAHFYGVVFLRTKPFAGERPRDLREKYLFYLVDFGCFFSSVVICLTF